MFASLDHKPDEDSDEEPESMWQKLSHAITIETAVADTDDFPLTW